MLAIFDLLGESFEDPDYRGCPFINAGAELSEEGHPAKGVTSNHRGAIHGLFADLGPRMSVRDPKAAAEVLSMLYDGAMVSVQLDGDTLQPVRARSAASSSRVGTPYSKRRGVKIRFLKEISMSRVCVFDVNETLLDLSALEPHFERVFGNAAVRQEWFGQMIHSALVSTVTGAYSDFGSVGAAALEMTAERHSVKLSDEDRQRILGTVQELPPHPDVREGLERLQDAGLRLATLTNSTQQVAESQIENSGLREYFEQVLSADSVQRLKPAAEPYRMAAHSLNEELANIRLIAAHAWDVAGAIRAGCTAAFVARPGKVLDPLVEPPDVVGRDIREVAQKILEAEKEG